MPDLPRLYKIRGTEADFNVYPTSLLSVKEVESPALPVGMDYVFCASRVYPYMVLYDRAVGVGAKLVALTERSDPTQWGELRRIVRLSDDTLYVLYYRKLAGNYQIYVKKSVDEGETWTDETLVSVGLEVGGHNTYPSIAVDSNDYLHVVWMSSVGYTWPQIMYNYYDGSWHTPLRISTVPGMDDYLSQTRPCIAVDSDDHLHVIWYGPSTAHPTYGQVWYREYIAAWGTIVRVSTAGGMENEYQVAESIAIDSLNNPHVAWEGRATGDTEEQIFHNYRNVDTWQTPTHLSTLATMENYEQTKTSIAIDSEDNIHIIWDGNTLGYPYYDQVWYVKYSGTWSAPIRISTYDGMDSAFQQAGSLGFDADGVLHVMWHGEATGLTDETKIWLSRYVTDWEPPKCLQPTGRNRFPVLRWSRWP